MITSWRIEHVEGGKWWSQLSSWANNKAYALSFPTEEDARAYQASVPFLAGHNVVAFAVEPVTRGEMLSDYDPTRIREPKRVEAEDTSRASWRNR